MTARVGADGLTARGAPSQCVVLVGGLGTRLGALAADCPKPLLPVAGKPFLDTLLWHVRRFGFERVLLLAGHHAEMVMQYAHGSNYCDRLKIEVIAESDPLGTAGTLRHASDALDESFLLLNGDTVFDFNWLDLVPLLTTANSALVAMAVRRLADASRFGVVDLNGDRVTGFRERGDVGGGLVNAGVYLMRRDVIGALPSQGSLEREVLPVLARRGDLCGRAYAGFFLDIGVPEAYTAAEVLIASSLRRPAIFFDRDGVLNVDHGYVGELERFEWLPGAIEAVKLTNDRGWFAFLVTNQAGVARGYYDEDAVHALHQTMQRDLRAHGAHLDDIRYCPHHPDAVIAKFAKACSCRKPEPGMIIDLINKWPVDPARSVLIGDKSTDLEAGRRAGIRALPFKGGDLVHLVSGSFG